MTRFSNMLAWLLCMAILSVSCRHEAPDVQCEPAEISVSLLTKAGGGSSSISSIDASKSWGLYVIDSDFKDDIVEKNAEMNEQEYAQTPKPVHFANHNDSYVIEIRGINFILAGYYPYVTDDKITVNSGHPVITRSLATKFVETRDGFFGGIASYSRYDLAPYVLEIVPKTTRLQFQAVVAEDITAEEINDYKIVSIGVHYKNGTSASTNSEYTYDIYSGEITDMKKPYGGHTYVFASEDDGVDGFNDGAVRPSPYISPGSGNTLPVILDMEVFPEEESHFNGNDIYVEFRYMLQVSAGEWREVVAKIPMENFDLSNGWEEGWIYKYRINIGRRKVEFDDYLEIVPWAFDPAQDQFSGIIE